MTTALIDGDLICYRCAASCQKQGILVEPLEVAIFRVDELMRRILYEVNSSTYQVFLTGTNNFRYKYNPDYKANRKDTKRPEWLEPCREHLVLKWNAEVSDGCEADDLLSIAQTKLLLASTYGN